MNIPEMADAISSAMGNDKLKFIFGDCCNFGAIEIAYELRNITEYVIGSPAEIPDMGATYDLLVPDMFIENDNFHRQMIDHYYNYYIEVMQSGFAHWIPLKLIKFLEDSENSLLIH